MAAQEGVVLVGVDGSTASLAAVDWAATEAVSTGCELVICHAIPGGIQIRDRTEAPFTHLFARGERIVRVAARRARASAAGLQVSTEVISQGLPSAALLDQTVDARIAVVGSRGSGMFRGLLLGSTSQQVATHATCPVVVVHERPAPGASTAAPVTVGLDWCGHEPLLALAFDYADRHHRSLVAVHAYRITEPPQRPGRPGEPSVLPRAAEEMLADATAPWQQKYPDVPVHRQVLTQAPATALIQESARSALIVVGPRGHGGFAGLLLGSVSQHVLRHGRCPIAIAR
ncbi:MAG TPA: universal stress protein [Mycobacteriales bacterium]|nr:universal stress protein [Mycobacteriales bacterium]